MHMLKLVVGQFCFERFFVVRASYPRERDTHTTFPYFNPDRPLQKILQKLPIKLTTTKPEPCKPHTKENAGFTLLEVLVVVVIIGILSAIAAPSWQSFVNKQQANKATDVIFSALQTAQREAKRTKKSYSVSFVNDSNNIPQVAIYQSTSSPTGTWKQLLNDLSTQTQKMVIGTNLTTENTASSTTISYNSPASLPTTKPSQTITFDYMGALDFSSLVNTKTTSNNIISVQSSNLGTTGLIVAVNVANGGTPKNTDIKRCVIVKTLLGSMQMGKDSACKL